MLDHLTRNMSYWVISKQPISMSRTYEAFNLHDNTWMFYMRNASNKYSFSVTIGVKYMSATYWETHVLGKIRKLCMKESI